MTSAERTAQEVNNSSWFEHLVRVGLVSYGIVHLLIGWLALQIAFGDRSGSPSQQGALTQIAQEPYGEALLWVIAFGFIALTVWQSLEAFIGHRTHDNPERMFKQVVSAGKAVLYLMLGVAAGKTAMGESSKSSEDSTTAKLMDLPLGQLIVFAVGATIIGIGIALMVKGAKKKFEKDLEPRATSGHSGTAVVKLAQVGYIAKGIAFGVLGGLFVWAALTHDADKAGGLDTALHKLLDTPLGPWLLGVVAAGIVCFGVYCFAWARYADPQS